MKFAQLYKDGKEMEIFAFYGPGCGKYSNGKPMGDGTDMRTKERYIEYKECGFDILLLEDETLYNGEPWETCEVKKVMDIAYEIGLKVIVLDRRIYNLAVLGYEGKELEGITVNTQEDLVKVVSIYMKDYSNHPAFFGAYIMDEPPIDILDRASAVVGAIKAVKNCYVHICHTSLGANYKRNEEFVKRDNWTDITWDDYLFQFYESPKNPKLCRVFHLYMEKIKKFAQRNNLGFTAVTLQAFGGDIINGCTAIGWRQVDKYDLRYQMYSSMLYFPTRLCWFHYWPSMYNTSGNTEKSIMSPYGEKVMYDDARELNLEIKELSKVTNNFDFVGVNAFGDKKAKMYYFLNDIDFVYKNLTVDKIKGEAVISEAYDAKNDVTGYMIHNTKDPLKRKKTVIHLNFKGATKAEIYLRGKPTTVDLKDGKYTLKLPCAEGCFVIPY